MVFGKTDEWSNIQINETSSNYVSTTVRLSSKILADKSILRKRESTVC